MRERKRKHHPRKVNMRGLKKMQGAKMTVSRKKISGKP